MRKGIVGFVGIVGILGCSVAEPPQRNPEPGTGTGTGTGTGPAVSVQTTPETFVWLEPYFTHEFPQPEGAAYMDQQGQMFIPETLLARTGQPVHFRSSEDLMHNIRVMRDDNTPIFNVITPPWGSYTHTFDEPGFYNVTCDIHLTMRATVQIASTPYVGTADQNGRFTFDRVVPGSYKASGFANGSRIEKNVDVAGTRVDVTLR